MNKPERPVRLNGRPLALPCDRCTEVPMPPAYSVATEYGLVCPKCNPATTVARETRPRPTYQRDSRSGYRRAA